MTVLNTLRQTGRAAVLAVVLAGTALSAVPVQAAPLQGFSLEIKPQGGENQKQFKQFKKKNFGPDDFFNWWLTDKRVEAAYDEWYYSFRVNRCSGMVDKIKKLYPVWEEDEYDDDDWY